MLKKKFFALLLCAAMAVSVGALAEGTMSAASSYSEILNRLGLQLIAPGAAQEAAWYVIDGGIAQVGFSIYEAPYTLRAKAAAQDEDISGMTFGEGAETLVSVLWNEGSFRAEEGVGARVRWHDALNGVAYSLSCEDAGVDGGTLAEYAADAYRCCAKGVSVELPGDESTGYIWGAMNYDVEKITVSAPIYEETESGRYIFVIAGEQANVEDAVSFVYYCPEQGLGSVTAIRNFSVRIDGDYNAEISEESAG